MIQKKLIYMVLGGFLALALTFGAFAAFAQTDDGADTSTPDTTTPDTSTDNGSSATTPALPGFGRFGDHGMDRTPPANRVDDGALLADALGITTEELQAAQTAAHTAAIEQAVADGLLTQEQADQILANGSGFHGEFAHGGFGHTDNYDALLADALGISTEELTAAQAEAYTARLAQMVEDGVLTQEQADQMQAYKNVQGYVDYDALNSTVQSYFEEAIAQALADGVITQAQADLMVNNLANMDMHGLGGPGFGGHGPGFGGRGHGHGGFNGSNGRDSFAPFPQTPSDTTTDSSGA